MTIPKHLMEAKICNKDNCKIIKELEEYLVERIKYWEEQEKSWIKQGFMKFGGKANTKIIFKGLLDKLNELKEMYK